ncbi:hypothetical protein B0H63DRAFT_517518 [Podospora didyma]|uniref:Uncharacterized protein n=1 Tax=Podospora didyma TaxID=330526 RepID=A0AAE0P6V1_9PEZI|nr:hypothetical protein B0H63DRAFT_517518 [Podospora didyma]
MSTSTPRSHPSPKKEDHDQAAPKTESSVLPAQQQQQLDFGAVQPMDVDSNSDFKMAEDQNPYPKPLQQASNRAQVRTPEPRGSKERMNGHKEIAERSPSTPGHLAPFDWEEFEGRYEEALAEANRHEQELLEEFEVLVKYFNVWASAASVHDSERGVKRLQTRERYVKIAEQSLSQKKKHLTEVVRAFQSALALLSQS